MTRIRTSRYRQFLKILALYLMYIFPNVLGIIPGSLRAAHLVVGLILMCVFFAPRTLLKKIHYQPLVLLMLSFSLALSGADLVLRVVTPNFTYYRPEDMFLNRSIEYKHLQRFTKNKSFDGKVSGDLSALTNEPSFREYRSVRFETDEKGFRNAPGLMREEIDLLLIGDSFGIGNGTSQEKTWASLLRDKYSYSLYNLSTGGSPWNELANLKTEIAGLKTKPGATVVWALFSGNDLGGEYHDVQEIPRHKWHERIWAWHQTLMNRSPLKRVFSSLKYVITLQKAGMPEGLTVRKFINGKDMLFLSDYKDKESMSYEQVLRHANFKKLSDVFAQMKRLSDENNLKVLVFVIPTKEGVYSWLYDNQIPWTTNPSPTGFAAAVQSLSQKQGFGFVDSKPAFVSESKLIFERSGESLWWYDDTHWNDQGHALAAKLVRDYLSKKERFVQ